MIILTQHCKERILERYGRTEKEFKKEMKKIFKLQRTKKLGPHGEHIKKKDHEILKYKQHKIIYHKDQGNYVIITYGKRKSSNTCR